MADTRARMTMTGHCLNKQCEGTKPKSPSGKPMPVCTAWDWCKCKCHKQITDMYKTVGMDREPPEQNSDYEHAASAERSLFVMPLVPQSPILAALSSPDGVSVPPNVEDPHNGTQDPLRGTVETRPVAPAVPVFRPTPTGRRARGQLEYDVLQVCQEFADDVYEWEHCTPKLVAERIGKMNTTEPPSTGAINAVWDRWERLGFATQAKKPSRFIGFTTDCTDQARELDTLKSRSKRDSRRTQEAQRRGSLRRK